MGQEIKTISRAKLDKERIQELLQKADSKWFASHGGQFNYQEHLQFTAEYLVKHYKIKGNVRQPKDWNVEETTLYHQGVGGRKSCRVRK